MDLEGITLSEISQTEKDKALYVLTFIWDLKIKTNEYNNQKQASGYQWEEGRGEGQDRNRGLRGTNYYVYSR